MKSGSTFRESLVNDNYGELTDPENQTQAQAKCHGRGWLIFKVVLGLLVLGATVGLIVHFVAKSKDSDNGLVTVNNVYASIARNDGAEFKIGNRRICDWQIVDYGNVDDVEIVDDHGRNLKAPIGVPQPKEDPVNWAETDDWYIHTDPELLVEGTICDNPRHSEVTLIVEPNTEVRGEFEVDGDMFRIDTVDKDTSKIVEMTEEDQEDPLGQAEPTEAMKARVDEWHKLNANLTDYPDDQRRNLQNGKIIWAEYVIGFASAQRHGPSRAAQYMRELNTMINNRYYRPLGFDLRVRRTTIRTSYLSHGGCGQILTALPGAHRKANDVHLVHYVSAQDCGGGVAYLGGLYNGNWAYAVSGSINGDFGRWDNSVVAHEFGHNFGSEHTHDLSPPADTCGLGCRGGRTEVGTLMSYCHVCGGWPFVREEWHPRNAQQVKDYYTWHGHLI